MVLSIVSIFGSFCFLEPFPFPSFGRKGKNGLISSYQPLYVCYYYKGSGRISTHSFIFIISMSNRHGHTATRCFYTRLPSFTSMKDEGNMFATLLWKSSFLQYSITARPNKAFSNSKNILNIPTPSMRSPCNYLTLITSFLPHDILRRLGAAFFAFFNFQLQFHGNTILFSSPRNGLNGSCNKGGASPPSRGRSSNTPSLCI